MTLPQVTSLASYLYLVHSVVAHHIKFELLGPTILYKECCCNVSSVNVLFRAAYIDSELLFV